MLAWQSVGGAIAVLDNSTAVLEECTFLENVAAVRRLRTLHSGESDAVSARPDRASAALWSKGGGRVWRGDRRPDERGGGQDDNIPPSLG